MGEEGGRGLVESGRDPRYWFRKSTDTRTAIFITFCSVALSPNSREKAKKSQQQQRQGTKRNGNLYRRYDQGSSELGLSLTSLALHC